MTTGLVTAGAFSGEVCSGSPPAPPSEARSRRGPPWKVLALAARYARQREKNATK